MLGLQIFTLLSIPTLLYTYEIEPLERTSTPPEKELGYWCTYANHCRFCWDCQDGICRNKAFKNHSPILENDYIANCSIYRRNDFCIYHITSIKPHKTYRTECPQHINHERHEADIRKWQKLLTYGFYLAGCILAVNYIRKRSLQTVMYLLVFLVISFLLSQLMLYGELKDKKHKIGSIPPKRELEHWCTHGKYCNFCWDCQNGICKNKAFKNHPPIGENDFIRYDCWTTHLPNKCSYEKIYKHFDTHIMECSQPTHFKWYDNLMKKQDIM